MSRIVVCVRHGETEWSRDRRHTGRTDLPLTAAGRDQALRAGRALAGREWAVVLSSPLLRARETAQLAGHADPELVDDLMEWDYGAVEGRTTAELRAEQPGWEIWRDGPEGGETATAVGERADRVIRRVVEADGGVLLFAHGHLLRILAARWIGLEASHGRAFKLDTAAICELGFEREHRAVETWNATGHLRA